MQFWRLAIASEFPREHCCMTFVVAERLAVGRLMLLAKMPTSRFVALERVPAHQLGEFEEIGNAPGAFEGLVKIFVTAQDAHILPEFFSQLRNFLQRFAQTLFVARHSAFLPEEKAEFSVERIKRPGAIHIQQLFNSHAHILLSFSKLRRIRRGPFSYLPGEITRQRVTQNKVTISQTLH